MLTEPSSVFSEEKMHEYYGHNQLLSGWRGLFPRREFIPGTISP